MSSHSEKLLEVELELRTLRGVREEVEALRSSVESIRSRLSLLDGGRAGTSSGTLALGQLGTDTHAYIAC